MNETLHPENQAYDIAARFMRGNLVERAIDTIVKPFSPGLLARRITERTQLAAHHAQLAYAAAYRSYQREYALGPLTTEEAQLPGYTRYQLMLEGRDLYTNFAIIRSAVNGVGRRVVGSGLHLQLSTGDKKLNRLVISQWNDWQERPEIRHLFSLREMLEQCVRSTYIDGDIGIILVDDEGDLRLALVEGDRIGPEMRLNINLDQINPIGGVNVDWRTGRPISYLVGERGIGGILTNCKPISVENFILMYRKQRVDQVRGVSLLAPVIQVARDLDKYLTSTRIQANINATFGVVIKREQPAMFQLMQTQPQGTTNPTTGAGGQNYRSMPLSTGQVTWLSPGEDISSFQPTVPTSQFDPYARFLCRQIALGMGQTYEMMMQDFTGMSWSSSKTVLLDSMLFIRQWQSWLAHELLDRIYVVWASKRMESGLLPEDERIIENFSWRGPANLGVDPNQEATAYTERLKAGMTTLEDIYLETEGADWQEKIDKRIAEVVYIEKRCQEKGIDPSTVSSVLPPGILKAKEAVDKMREATTLPTTNRIGGREEEPASRRNGD